MGIHLVYDVVFRTCPQPSCNDQSVLLTHHDFWCVQSITLPTLPGHCYRNAVFRGSTRARSCKPCKNACQYKTIKFGTQPEDSRTSEEKCNYTILTNRIPPLRRTSSSVEFSSVPRFVKAPDLITTRDRRRVSRKLDSAVVYQEGSET